MSVYQVRIKKWFVDPDSPFHGDLRVIQTYLDEGTKCGKCSGEITLEEGYCSHGIAYGYTDMYCSEQCAYGLIDEDED